MSADPTRIVAHRATARRLVRAAPIPCNPALLGEVAIFDVELDQCLGVLGDEGDRYDDYGTAISPCTADLLIRRGSDPFEWPDPALIANDRVEPGALELCDNRGYGSLDLLL